METRIDLDAAASAIIARREVWQAQGVTVGDLTWREGGSRWPAVIRTARSAVQDPDSVGVSLRKGAKEGRVVLFRGGWADLEFWNGDTDDEPLIEARGWNDSLTLARFADLLDRFGGYFTEP